MSAFTAFASGFLDSLNQGMYEQRMAKHRQALEDREQEIWQERNQQLQDWDLERDALKREQRLEDIRTLQERENAAKAEAKAADEKSWKNYYSAIYPNLSEEDLTPLIGHGSEGVDLHKKGWTYDFDRRVFIPKSAQIAKISREKVNELIPYDLVDGLEKDSEEYNSAMEFWGTTNAWRRLFDLYVSNDGLSGLSSLLEDEEEIVATVDANGKTINYEIKGRDPLPEPGKELQSWQHEAINNAIEGAINPLNNLLDGIPLDENNNPINRGPASVLIGRAKGEITQRYFNLLSKGKSPNIEAIAEDLMQEILPTIKELWNPVIDRAEDIWEDYTRDPNTVELNDLLTAYENYRTRLEVSELMPIGQDINELRTRIETILEDPRIIAVLAEAEGAPAPAGAPAGAPGAEVPPVVPPVVPPAGEQGEFGLTPTEQASLLTPENGLLLTPMKVFGQETFTLPTLDDTGLQKMESVYQEFRQQEDGVPLDTLIKEVFGFPDSVFSIVIENLKKDFEKQKGEAPPDVTEQLRRQGGQRLRLREEIAEANRQAARRRAADMRGEVVPLPAAAGAAPVRAAPVRAAPVGEGGFPPR